MAKWHKKNIVSATKQDNSKAVSDRARSRKRLRKIIVHKQDEDPLYRRHVEEVTDPFEGLYAEKKLVTPPYAFDNLYQIYEESDALQSAVEAMQMNVDGFGYQLQFLGDDIKEKDTPTANKEREKAEDFFNYANENQSWRTVRKLMREDLEVLGNGGLEVIRNKRNEMSLVYHTPFQRMRMSTLNNTPVTITAKIPRDGKIVNIKIRKNFRKFAQLSVTGKKLRWFKEFGDPRIMDATTGEYKKDRSQAKLVASEIMYFKLPFGNMVYGLPRWIGAILEVMGRRSASFVNYDLFENQGLPPLAVLVSGGVLTDESVDELESLIRSMRGVEHWNRVAILESNIEGVGLEDRGSAKIELKNLSEFRKEDLMFDRYMTSTEKNIRHRFRLPPLYVGAAETFCVSTDTETLTDRGWINIDEYQDGDKIATIDPSNGQLEYHVPEEVHIFPSPEKMIHFHSRGVDAMVTPNHDMYCQKYIKSMPPWEKIHAEDMLKSPTDRHLFRVAPTDTEVGDISTELPIDDVELFMEFIGIVVADGHITRRGHGIRFDLKKERKKNKYSKLVKEVCEVSGGQYTEAVSNREGYKRVAINHSEIHRWCEDNLLTNEREKQLPEWIWTLEASLAEILLEALIFSDGCTVGRGPNSQVYVTTSSMLADQIQALGFRLGWRTRIKSVDGSERKRKTTHYVHMTKTTTQMIERKSINEVKAPTSQVYCFHVENHLFVVRRNGKIIITGNTHATAKAAQTVAEEQLFIPERGDFDETINIQVVRTELGIKMWKYVTKGPRIVGAQELSKGVETFTRAGAFSVNHAIERANEAFGLEMSKYDAAWADYPLPFVLKLIEQGQILGIEDVSQPQPQLPVPKQASLLPVATEKMGDSDVFSPEERHLYKTLVTLQSLIETANKCSTDKL